MKKNILNRISSLPAAAVIVAVAVLTLAAYSGSFHDSFHFDDLHQISLNPHIREVSNIPRFFTEKGLNTSLPNIDFYRPVTTSSFALNYALGGLDVTGYHVVNIALHLINALLVFAIVGAVIRKSYPDASRLYALAVSLLFALHPVQTQAVTYISGRAVLLASFFSLSALYAFMRYRESSGTTAALWGAASPVLLLLGLLSKEMTIGTVGVMLAYDLIFSPSDRLRKAGTWLYYLGFAAAGAALVLARSAVGVKAGIPGMDYTAGQYLMCESKVVLMYVRLLLLPYGQNADYMLPLTRTFDAGVGVSAALIAAFAAWQVRGARRRPAESFFGLWFLIALLPESSFFPILDIAVEYRIYLPSVGFIALGVLLAKRYVRRPAALAALCAVVLIAFGAATYARNMVWATDYTLWSDTVKKSPDSARAESNLGVALLDEKRYTEAIPVLERALSIETKFPETHKIHANLGDCYRELGMTDKAIEQYKASIKAKPDFTDAYDSLGWLCFESGRYAEAADAFSGKLRLSGYDPQTEYNLAIALMMTNKDGEAIEHMKRVMTYLPDSFDAHYNLGLLYERTGRMREASEQAGLALKLATNPYDASEAKSLMDRTGSRNR